MTRAAMAGGLAVHRVRIGRHPVSALAASVRADYERIHGSAPERRGGWYHPDDWRRVSYVAEQLRPGGAVLDVGVGSGQFLNMLARSGRFDRVVGVDKARFKKFVALEPDMTKLDGDLAALAFADGEFDVVTCMEVLEHVPHDVFVAGLAELRRVCRGQLVMSVPFREPEPISSTHVSRFDVADVQRWFPDGRLTLLDRPHMPWLVIEERFDGTEPEPTDLVDVDDPLPVGDRARWIAHGVCRRAKRVGRGAIGRIRR